MPDVMTVDMVAGVLGVGRGTAYNAVRDRQIPSVKVGGRILVSKQALQQMLGVSAEGEGNA